MHSWTLIDAATLHWRCIDCLVDRFGAEPTDLPAWGCSPGAR